MGRLQKITKNSFLFFILFFLWINILQDIFKLEKSPKPLGGYFELHERDTFTVKKWLDGSFSENTATFLNEQFGFRNHYVRLDHQWRFSVFGELKFKDFFVGKDNYIYQQGYVNEYNGANFIGMHAINDTLAKLRELQAILKDLGKNVLVVIAPSKARIYPEFIPDNMRKGPIENCNYAAYAKALNENKIDLIDFNNWYLKKKKESKYLLFPQTGVHWSRLEAVYAADTIIKRIAAISGRPTPLIKVTKIVENSALEEGDDDALSSLNLMFLPEHKNMAYPQYEIINNEKADQSTLVISDSFWWDIYSRKIPYNVFKNNEFWYYAKEAYGNNFFGMKEVKNLDIHRKILQYDNIVIICAESNLSRLGFGFISLALNAMKQNITPTEEEIKSYENDIRNSIEWMNSVVLKAKQRHQPVDSALRNDAIWMVNRHGPKFSESSIEEVVKLILNTPEWLEQIKKKAEEGNISIDSMLLMDARYMLEEQKKKL